MSKGNLKAQILSLVSEADIIRFYFPTFKQVKDNFKNPLSEKDNTPSLNWYKDGEQWKFKAHNTGEQGDIWQYVAELYKLDCKSQFNEVCNRIITDLKLSIELAESKAEKVFEVTNFTEPNESFYKFWEQWKVDKATLQRYQVQQVEKLQKDKYLFNYTSGVVISFLANGRQKVYIPLIAENEKWTKDKDGKHTKKVLKNQINTDIFGAANINQGQDVFICEGEKDTLVLASQGYNAICFQSATAKPTAVQIEAIKKDARNVFVCYDTDAAGKACASWLQAQYGLKLIHLPETVKDIADYFQLANTDDFDLLVQAATNAVENKKGGEDWNPDQEESVFHKVERYLNKHYDLRMNAVKLRVEYSEKGKAKWSEANENNFYIEMKKSGIKVSINDLKSLLRSDFIKKFNPIHDYFITLDKWDEQTDYIQQLASYVNAIDEEFTKHFKKWLVRAVKCVINNGYFNKNALVFIGKQNDGKTTFCRFLCPPILEDYIIEHITDDKDGRLSVATNFIINIDELANLNKNDTDKLKSTMSLTQINERLPYDSRNSVLPRIASFIGSTNNREFLSDGTGNVRWVCFEVAGFKFEYKTEIDINKVWAQAYHLANTNFESEITRDEMVANEERNKKFTVMSQEAELIQEYFRTPEPHEICKAEYLNATMIMNRLAAISHLKLSNGRVGRALQQLGYHRTKMPKTDNYGYAVIQTKDRATPMPSVQALQAIEEIF